MSQDNHYYSTRCKCGNLLLWSEDQQSPECDKCGKTEDWEYPPVVLAGPASVGHVEFAPPIKSNESLREWWHQILGHYDRYPSYAILLALPSNNEALRYLKDYGKELHLITGKDCLVITLTGFGFMQYGFDDRIMPLAVEEGVAEGYCLQAAELFKIKYHEFPCLVLFRDIRSSEHLLVALKGLSAEQIGLEMRTLFSVIKEAVEQNRDPITAVEKHNRQQALSEKKRATWGRIESLAGKTIETMMEAFFKAAIPKQWL